MPRRRTPDETKNTDRLSNFTKFGEKKDQKRQDALDGVSISFSEDR